MITKLPVTANRVITFALRRGASRGERGIALISVIAVLVLLAMVATPFLMTMRDSAARGEKFLYGQRADAEAESLFEAVRSQLVGGIEHIERRKLDAMAPLSPTSPSSLAPAGDATPNFDTPDEFAMPQDVLARFNQASAKEHRVWTADVVDSQTLFNLNNCGFPVLANILGRTEVAAATTADKLTITLAFIPESFPKTDGVLRIGTECVKYKSIIGNDLVNCERGYMPSTACNGPAHDLEVGDPVTLEACFQIATRPFRLRPPAWVKYTHVDQARTISDLGVAPLAPEDFERLRPFVTAWSGNAVGDGWANPQKVRTGISANDKSTIVVRVKNVRYFGPGTTVQITDGVNYDYAVVARVRGVDEVELAGDIKHDYAADQTRMYCLARSPINVNTADVATLSLVFEGLRLRGKTASVTRRQAGDLAAFLKTWLPKPVAGESTANPTAAPGRPGVYRDWEDLTLALEDAKNAGKLDDDAFKAILLNAMNSNDSLLAFSTVPFVFRGNDVYEIRATASIQGSEGRELARRELRRVMEVSTTKTGTFVLDSQADIQNQIMKSRDAKYMMTYPVSVANYDSRNPLNIPPSEYSAFAQRNQFPSTDRSVGVGNVQLAPAAVRFGTTNSRVDHVQHFDEERIPDGFALGQKTFSMAVSEPYAPEKGTLDLVDTVDISGFAEGIELGLREFACSFWYRPDWDRGGADQYIFDYGLDSDHMDRVSLRYDHEKDELVLAVADATREPLSCEVRYKFDHGTWVSKQWYHVAVHVGGCSPGMMELFVDGMQQGGSSVQTRLTSAVAPVGGGSFSLQVEDAKNFPDVGVVILRGKEGVELMEYSSKLENSLNVTRRKARTMTHQTPETNMAARTHNEGDTVELYGFSAPLISDVRQGGASLSASLGAWRAYRFICNAPGDMLETTPAAGGNPIPITRGLANGTSNGTQVVVNLQDWDTGSTDANIFTDLGSPGSEGVAMIISALYRFSGTTMRVAGTPAPQFGTAADPQSVDVGGIEFVRYTVGTSGTVNITARNLQLQHFGTTTGPTDNLNRFIPTYSYGDTNEVGSTTLGNASSGATTTGGAMTAFIPIAVVASGGSNPKYLDPQDEEPQLAYGTVNYNNQAINLAKAFVQIDGEWIAYDTFDQNTSGGLLSSGRVAFYRDMTIPLVGNLTGASISPFGAGSNQAANQTLQLFTSTPAASYGVPGGTGGNATNDPPPAVQDKNLETDAPYVPVAPGTATGLAPTAFAIDIARALDFRGYENRNGTVGLGGGEFRIANTIPPSPAKIHAAGSIIIPTFAVVTGNNFEYAGILSRPNDGAKWAAPGFNDLITLRDKSGNDDQLRLQWGYLQLGMKGYFGWCGPTAISTQTWGWDRPQTADFDWTLRRWDSRAFTRAIKFPSGEMPDSALTRGKPDFIFGKKYDGTGGTSGATIDEIEFHSNFRRAEKDGPNYAFLGIVPPAVVDPVSAAQAQQQQNQQTGTNTPVVIEFNGIDASADEIDVHLGFTDGGNLYSPSGLGVDPNTYADDGGVIKIDDELILYEQFDPASGKFTNCRRGAFGTEPASHEYEAIVAPVWAFPCSILVSSINTTSGDYELKSTADFPDDGYFRVGLSGEIIGYTDWNVNNHLAAPLGRIDPTTDRDPSVDSKRVGGSIFRGRFGTIPAAASQGDVVVAMPFRVYDRYAEHADDPEQSYLGLSWTKHGAIWKRISWDAEPRTNIEVVALLRFSGGPAWDADRIIHVGQEGIPDTDRRKWLYQITDPKAENLLNIEADRIEVRLGVRYARGAYDPFGLAIAPDSWKETPEIRRIVVEYVSPPQVLTQE